jgi:hypothetical protein
MKIVDCPLPAEAIFTKNDPHPCPSQALWARALAVSDG